ncbi:ATP synthase subunit I [Plesiomonas shigelloides]|uniref:ATP synthase subunit I n=1 Tax=Plesiomonas shigelloides TaxID=703 RepID=UPI0012624EDC|nr:ATP synthase subunit I [Plesiomonas shigelloides]KAB7664348.1 F0F1 ATP synthase subunit I [Plesiomonas shigelloides]
MSVLTLAGRRFARRIWWIQASVVLLFSLLFSVYRLQWGWSALACGVVVLIPNALFAWFAFRYGGALHSEQVMRSFMVGELTKIFVTVALFALVYRYMDVLLLPLCLTYLAVLAVNLLAPVIFNNNE